MDIKHILYHAMELNKAYARLLSEASELCRVLEETFSQVVGHIKCGIVASRIGGYYILCEHPHRLCKRGEIDPIRILLDLCPDLQNYVTIVFFFTITEEEADKLKDVLRPRCEVCGER